MSSFRPAFYTNLGYNRVINNGPDAKIMEQKGSNGHIVEVSPLKRVLQRTIPELRDELEPVVNVFDPCARAIAANIIHPTGNRDLGRK